MKKAEKKLKKLEENEKRINNKVNAIIFPSFVDKEKETGKEYIKLKNINKIYDNNTQAVFDFNINIEEKEFIVFVGPSGCGKSTTLRMICGLEEISNGGLFIDGRFANELAPKDRDVAMVFQSYALYPHMSVYDNMAFSLKIRKKEVPVLDKEGNQVLDINHKAVNIVKHRINELKSIKQEDDAALKTLEVQKAEYNEKTYEELVSYYNERNDLVDKELAKKEKALAELETTKSPKFKLAHYTREEIDQRIKDVSKILQIEPFLTRKPKALSGGQRQRVALGRAIVRDAKVFLMDEPLSNLDAKLRVAMRSEIVALHRKIEATTIYVTHDQTEAMTMADRIVVMKDGVVQQIGSPKNIFSLPSNLFVATFIGSPSMNIIDATFTKDGIKINDDVQIELNKKNDTTSFYKNELKRFEELKTNLETALLDKNDKNSLIYTRALEKVEGLIKTFESRKNNYPIKLGIRPEHIQILEKGKGDANVEVEIVEMLGSELYIHAHIGENPIVIRSVSGREINTGDRIEIKFNIADTHYFDVDTEQAIR